MSNAGGELSGPQRTASHFSVGAASRVGCNGLLAPAPAVSRRASTRGRASSWRDDNVLDLRHVATSGGGGLLRSVPALASVHVRRVPVPPVVRWGDRLERTVMFGRFMQELCKRRDVHRSDPAREP